jgi:tetratricopeptide (TPR) repeat protein
VYASLIKVGDVRLAAGDRTEALTAYEESLAIRRKLAAADPGNAGWQRDLSVSLERVGDVRLAAGERAGALAAYDDGLAIRRKLAAADPGNAERQAELVISLYKVSTASDPSRARAVLREALAIAETLARAGKLTAAQQNWPQMLRELIAKLPPEQAEAR